MTKRLCRHVGKMEKTYSESQTSSATSQTRSWWRRYLYGLDHKILGNNEQSGVILRPRSELQQLSMSIRATSSSSSTRSEPTIMTIWTSPETDVLRSNTYSGTRRFQRSLDPSANAGNGATIVSAILVGAGTRGNKFHCRSRRLTADWASREQTLV